MKEDKTVVNGDNLPEGFSAPFDPTFWLGQLEEYFTKNKFKTSAGLIIMAKQAWEKDKE